MQFLADIVSAFALVPGALASYRATQNCFSLSFWPRLFAFFVEDSTLFLQIAFKIW